MQDDLGALFKQSVRISQTDCGALHGATPDRGDIGRSVVHLSLSLAATARGGFPADCVLRYVDCSVPYILWTLQYFGSKTDIDMD